MGASRRWCDTSWNYCKEEHSVLDQVYVGLELDSDVSRRLNVHFLQNPNICTEFIGSLSGEILKFDYSSNEMEEKILDLILRNSSLFASYRSDIKLISFIEKHLTSSSRSTTSLAREVLLSWSLPEASDESIKSASSPLGSSGIQKKFSESTSGIEASGSPFNRRRLESTAGGDCGNQLHLTDSEGTNLTGNDIQLDLESRGLWNSCSVYQSLRIPPDRMTMILSSLSDTEWLSSIQDDSNSREFEEILPKRNDQFQPNTHSILSAQCEMKSETSLEASSVAIGSCVTAACTDRVTSDIIGLATDMRVEEIEAAKPSMTPALGAPSLAEAKVADIVQDEAHKQLLICCRAHRATVLRMTSSVGTGALAPKSVQQLCQSGCSLLIRIGSITSDLKWPIEAPYEHQSLSQSQPHSQLSQYPASGAVVQTECSLDGIMKQTHALMALSLHCAPDEVIAAVSDLLLTKISSQTSQSIWQEEDRIQPVTAALFLSGILLLRVRILSAHASRLLLRAVEASVKKAPAVTIGFLLPSMMGPRCGSNTGLCQQSSMYQHEMVQRVARQVLSEAQCDNLLLHLSVSAASSINRSDDSLPPTMLATCYVVDALLCSALSDFPRAANAPAGKGHSNKRKHGQSSSSAKAHGGDRSMTMELSVIEQDACLSKWTSAVSSSSSSSSNNAPYGGTLGSLWCARIGIPIHNTPLPELESDILGTINSILSKMSSVSPETARALFDLLSTASAPVSTGTAEVSESVTGSGTGTSSSSSSSSSSLMRTSGKAPSTKANAVASVMTTLATRFSKVIVDCGLKKEAMTVSGRCGASLALSALQKMS